MVSVGCKLVIPPDMGALNRPSSAPVSGGITIDSLYMLLALY